ncbi:MAG: hypothetical protein RMI78_00435 [Nitrososphaerota archaeon]|nr:hypothetical protein [Nitrososphaerota archaeon]
MSPFTGKKDRLEELEARLSDKFVDLEGKVFENIRRIIDALNRVEARFADIQSTLRELSSHPELIKSKLGHYLEKVEEISNELESVRYYENTLLSIQDGLKDVIEALSKEREMIKQEVNALLKEKGEISAIYEEVRKWREELDAKERQLALREAELRELEEKKATLEKRIQELENHYFKMLDEARTKLEEMMKGMLRDFKLKEIRLERLVRREAELREGLEKLRQREEEAEELERKLLQLRSELNALSERKKKLESEIKSLEDKRVNLEKIVADMRRAILSP